MQFNFIFLRILHLLNILQNAMYVASSRFDTHAIRPADLKVTYGSSVVVADIKQPVEDFIVIFRVCNDLICAVEDGRCFGVYDAAGAEERGIRRCTSGLVAVVNESFLA